MPKPLSLRLPKLERRQKRKNNGELSEAPGGFERPSGRRHETMEPIRPLALSQFIYSMSNIWDVKRVGSSDR